MAKIDLKSGNVKLEGGDVATVALMAGLLAAVDRTCREGVILTPEDCAERATVLYKEVVRDIFIHNQIPSDEAALDLLVEIWSALPESNTEVPLGEELTQRLAEFLLNHGRMNEDGDTPPVAASEEQGRPKSLGLDSHFNDTSRRGHGR